jgi:CBS domain containing-hemolysin-like protein
MDDLVGSFILLFVLFLLSSFFSSAETAFTSLSKIRLESDAKNGNIVSQKILKLINNPKQFLTVILLGNNIVNIAAASISTYVVMKLIDNREYAVLVSTFGVTLIVLIFGEIIPKSLATHYSFKLAKMYYKWVKLFEFIMTPLIYLVNILTYPILSKFKSPIILHMTEDDFKYQLEKSSQNGVFDEDASEIITNAVEFKDITVSEILTPRVDISRLNKNVSIKDAIEYATEAGFSRIPIIEDSVDNIIGIAHIKDMFKKYLDDYSQIEKIPVGDIMRTPYRIPEDKKINELLWEMKKAQIQMAIVIDEYGGTEGLVTIEDILEEIVGEIRDEYDTEIDDVIEIDMENSRIVLTGRADIGQINDLLDISLPEDDFETIGGLVFNELGRVAEVGDELIKENVKIIVNEVNGVNLTRLTVVLLTESELNGDE